MTREQLIWHIRQHERRCAKDRKTSFEVVSIIELADGVLATLESDGEYALWFDKNKCRIGRCALEDSSECIADFAPDVGIVDAVTASSWSDIRQAARIAFVSALGNPVDWHNAPIVIEA